MKKYLVSILLSIIIALTANIVYGANDNLKDVKYYNNLIKNENIATILLNKNTKTRKTTKKEVMNFDKNITKIKDSKGNELKETDVVKTGDYITINKIDYKVVLYGDVNKDGYICDIEDIMIIENNYLGKRNVSQIEKLAGNLQNNDNTLDIEDIMKMANTYLGTLKTDIISKVPSGNVIIKTEDDKNNANEDKKDNTNKCKRNRYS